MHKIHNDGFMRLALSLLAACASRTTVRTEGRVENDRYIHPGGLFAVDVPALFREGSVIEDEYRGSVGSSETLRRELRVRP